MKTALAWYYLATALGAAFWGTFRHDWTWHLVAAFCGFSSVLYWGALAGERVQRGAEGLLRWCPAWMNTRAGKWFATRVPFVGRRWKRNMDAALVYDADVEQAFYQIQLLIAVNRWAYCFEDASGEASEIRNAGKMMAAWCAWRTAAEALHRHRERQAGKRLDLPASLAGMPRMEDLDWSGTSATH